MAKQSGLICAERMAHAASLRRCSIFGLIRGLSVHFLGIVLIILVFVIVPVFALANTGIELSAHAWSHAVRSPVAWAVFVGLVVGSFRDYR